MSAGFSVEPFSGEAPALSLLDHVETFSIESEARSRLHKEVEEHIKKLFGDKARNYQKLRALAQRFTQLLLEEIDKGDSNLLEKLFPEEEDEETWEDMFKDPVLARVIPLFRGESPEDLFAAVTSCEFSTAANDVRQELEADLFLAIFAMMTDRFLVSSKDNMNVAVAAFLEYFGLSSFLSRAKRPAEEEAAAEARPPPAKKARTGEVPVPPPPGQPVAVPPPPQPAAPVVISSSEEEDEDEEEEEEDVSGIASGDAEEEEEYSAPDDSASDAMADCVVSASSSSEQEEEEEDDEDEAMGDEDEEAFAQAMVKRMMAKMKARGVNKELEALRAENGVLASELESTKRVLQEYRGELDEARAFRKKLEQKWAEFGKLF